MRFKSQRFTIRCEVKTFLMRECSSGSGWLIGICDGAAAGPTFERLSTGKAWANHSLCEEAFKQTLQADRLNHAGS